MELKACEFALGYAGTMVVEKMDLCVKKGEITSIIGPNGSGKSTVLKAMTRLLSCVRGCVCLNGTDICLLKPKCLARQIGVLPQNHTAPPDFKVRDLIAFGRVPHQKWYKTSNAEDLRVIDWAMQVTGTWDLRDKLINECSGGETQRVWIATVLAQQPEMLFLDEPTTYLDIAHQQDLLRLVKKLNKETGIGVVMVLHDLKHALDVSDRIVVLKDGEKYSEGTPEEVITAKMMKEVYAVNCEVIQLPGHKRPILVYEEIS